jgi:hypothetical protein
LSYTRTEAIEASALRHVNADIGLLMLDFLQIPLLIGLGG